jgi:dolichol-phosphate mannosyltransferase
MITAIIPAKEESETIELIVNQVAKYVDEIIVVTPTDDIQTSKKLIGLPCLHVTSNTPGKGVALVKGVEKSKGEIIVFIDADLSHDPSVIPRLVLPIQNGDASHVCASRMLGGSSELFYDPRQFVRLVGSHLITLMINYKYKSNLTDSQNGFRAMYKDLFIEMNLREIHTTIEQEMTSQTLRLGKVMIEIPAHEFAREYGTSKINVLRGGWRYVWVIIKILLRPKPRGWGKANSQSIQNKYEERWFDGFI